VERQRGLHQKNQLPVDKKELLLEIDDNFFTQVRKGQHCTRSPWDPFLLLSCDEAHAGLAKFVDHRGHQYARGFQTVQQYVVYNLDVNDILPDDCIKSSPFGSVQRVLWHIKRGTSDSLSCTP